MECCEIGSSDPLIECILMNNTFLFTLDSILRFHKCQPKFVNTWDLSERQKWNAMSPNELNMRASSSFCLTDLTEIVGGFNSYKKIPEDENREKEEIRRQILDRIEEFDTFATLVETSDLIVRSCSPLQVIKEYAAKTSQTTFFAAILVGISIEQLLRAEKIPDLSAFYAFCRKSSILDYTDSSSCKPKTRSQSWLRERHTCYKTVLQFPELLFYSGSIRKFARNDFLIRQMIRTSANFVRWQDHSNIRLSVEYITKAMEIKDRREQAQQSIH